MSTSTEINQVVNIHLLCKRKCKGGHQREKDRHMTRKIMRAGGSRGRRTWRDGPLFTPVVAIGYVCTGHFPNLNVMNMQSAGEPRQSQCEGQRRLLSTTTCPCTTFAPNCMHSRSHSRQGIGNRATCPTRLLDFEHSPGSNFSLASAFTPLHILHHLLMHPWVSIHRKNRRQRPDSYTW
jgi:hypothetical protein